MAFTHQVYPAAESQPQPDEGYSEETRSIIEHDTQTDGKTLDERTEHTITSLLRLSLADRVHVLETAIRTLPHATKEQIGELCSRLTHFDPVYYLPQELTLQILSYLSPDDLLTCSGLSRAWRLRSQDEELWRNRFAQEGWLLDRARLAQFESSSSQQTHVSVPRSSLHQSDRIAPSLSRKRSRKRPREEAFSESETQSALLPADVDDSIAANVSEELDIMEGVEGMEENVVASPGRVIDAIQDDQDNNPWSLTRATPDVQQLESLDIPTRFHDMMSSPEPSFTPTLFRQDEYPLRVSWPYLYKQRCRLERNWEQGKYKTFQLPHPDFAYEGHSECVYAVQHTSHHLVSGSRDKTIRKWNLKTNRLLGKPLLGHEASVLCLQFDERPEHDLIVSGGSDSYVIIWKFSSGEILRKMTATHAEPVLNLRFDDRYIITCSKDKTIKIWTRRSIHRDDPLVPAHVVPTLDSTNPILVGDMIREYSLLSTLIGHGAAVNAVVMHGDTIVSASGDRTLRAWDIATGQCIRTYAGHNKGIACVQFDGRRIISGSSDHTVRIFDAEQAAEVACLQGHSNLVRTVQARFGDLDTITDKELQDESRKIDRDFFEALENGLPPNAGSRRHWRAQGSRHAGQTLSFGTKVPPGGGGMRWAKIVSGSYDETVIVWKRDREGKWAENLRLHQGLLPYRPPRTTIRPQARPDAVATAADRRLHDLRSMQNTLVQVNQMLRNAQQTQNGLLPTGTLTAIAAAQLSISNQLTQQNQALTNTMTWDPTHRSTTSETTLPATASSSATANASNVRDVAVANAVHTGTVQTHSHTGQSIDTVNDADGQTGPSLSESATQSHPQVLSLTQTQIRPQVQLAARRPHHHHHHHHVNANANAGAGAAGGVQPATRAVETNRVFKLQFDARRIVSCSQNKIIVGWDFANGDPELELIGDWSVETA